MLLLEQSTNDLRVMLAENESEKAGLMESLNEALAKVWTTFGMRLESNPTS